jgi:hypothetical protein
MLAVLVAATPALAGTPEQDKQFVAWCIADMTIIPLALFPLGLAFHLFLRAMAPRMTRHLVLNADAGRLKTFFLGLMNALILIVIAFAALHFQAHLVWLLAVFVYCALAFVGSHGLASSLGAKITGSPAPDLKELALGWFVLVYLGLFPIVGWCLAFYWECRCMGSALLAILTVEDTRS